MSTLEVDLALIHLGMRGSESDYETVKAELARLRTRLDGVAETVFFFASLIRSGEQWSETCEAALEATRRRDL